jgi:hypothetical protein
MSRKNQPIRTTEISPAGRASTFRRWVIQTDQSDVAVPVNSTQPGVTSGANRLVASQ